MYSIALNYALWSPHHIVVPCYSVLPESFLLPVLSVNAGNFQRLITTKDGRQRHLHVYLDLFSGASFLRVNSAGCYWSKPNQRSCMYLKARTYFIPFSAVSIDDN